MKPPKTQIQTVVNPVKECVLTLVGSHTPKPVNMKTKICTKCGKRKLAFGFHKKLKLKSGLTSWCKNCISVDNKEKYKENESGRREKAIKRGKEYRKNYPDKVQALRDKYIKNGRKANDDKKYQKRHINQIRIHQKRWYEKKKQNPEYIKKRKAKGVIRYRLNKRRINKQHKKWQKSHPGRNQQLSRESAKRSSDALSDSYIKSLLCSHKSLLCYEDVPKELVETKREYIKLGRILKGRKNENYEGTKRKVS